MKSIVFLLAGISLLALSGQAFSQDGGARKPLNNPMYSTHNYKHPNMAAAARRQESKAGVAVQQPIATDARLANYKNQMPNQQPTGGIRIDHTPSASLADRNYKVQRVSEPRPSVRWMSTTLRNAGPTAQPLVTKCIEQSKTGQLYAQLTRLFLSLISYR